MNIDLFPRTGFALVALLSAGLLAFAYYAQFVQGYEPCPLCILQRWAFIVIAVGALAGALHGSRGAMRWVYAAAVLAGGIWGVVTAGRHLWLQSLPAGDVPECGPGFDFMVEYFSLFEAVKSAFTGSGECAEVDWTFLGLAMPAWTLIWYVLLLLLTAASLKRKPS